MRNEWTGFVPGVWEKEIDVRDFIQKNYTPYDGDDAFLAGPTEDTKALWQQVLELSRAEREAGGVLDMDTRVISTITSHAAGYLDKEKETIVGFQTEKPFKRALMPYGGIRMAQKACEDNGYHVDPEVVEFFTTHRKTHNAGVFDAYTPEMRACRSSHIITGLPDAYGRGRIIGDYRRVALYGVDRLIEDKRHQKDTTRVIMYSDVIREREELSEQIRALDDLKKLGEIYGFDISRPAKDTREAIQWLYFGYLAAVKEQNGAAMSLGRVSTFLDIYFERDLAAGRLDEAGAQELMDDFVMKLRMARHLRTPEYNALFGGDPMWITEAVGGMGSDGRTLVTKTSFRMLHTLYNLGASPEPNLTILWSGALPAAFKTYCARVSCETDAIQYENDDLMRPIYGDDYAIACCVSAMRLGKDIQFFGARVNLPKLLLLSLNGGRDEMKNMQVGPVHTPYEGEYLEYGRVTALLDAYRPWLAELYADTMNVIHYMHDKYAYEKTQMALHDTHVHRYMAFGMAGLSVLADSLSAIKYAKVRCIRDAGTGLITDFEVEGDYPAFGNDDDRVDAIACEQAEAFYNELAGHALYRGAEATLSVLTITSNVVYGKKTGSTPDGRKAGQPFAPGANPMHRRDTHGAVASLASVAKLPFSAAQDGISNTFSIVPGALGKDDRIFAGDLEVEMPEFEAEH